MQSGVTFRKKQTGNGEDGDPVKRSLQFARPKSWGEFQSGLKTFQPIQRPKTSAKFIANKELYKNGPTLNGNSGIKIAGNEQCSIVAQ